MIQLTNAFITLGVNAQKATKQLKRLGYAIELWQTPKFLRPFKRFAYWIEERMGLHE